MLVLGIETSCDETSAAVVRDGREILSNAIWSQVRLHSPYGGVVPELASRAHIRNISVVVDMALERAGVSLDAIEAIAVTQGPGLVGSLLVGLEFAKALAFARGKPLVPVHHIAAHLYSPFLRQNPAAHDFRSVESTKAAPDDLRSAHFSGLLEEKAPTEVETTYSRFLPAPRPRYPYLGLAISGGHSSLIRVNGPGEYKTLGETRDDAVGEAYDKVAKLLQLGYPGGPILDRLAAEGNPRAIRFPRPLSKQKTFDFSFSGLKTAVLLHVQDKGLENIHADPQRLRDLAASFQVAVIDSLLEKTQLALERERLDSLAVVGGVACNRGLREALRQMQRQGFGGHARSRRRIRLWIPPPILCTDNAAMIAGLGYCLYKKQKSHGTDLTLNADPGLPLEADTAGR